MRRKYQPTLDDAKRLLGRAIRVGDELEATLEWSREGGWILWFVSSESWELDRELRLHRERSLQGHSWPGPWALIDLYDYAADHEQWVPREPNRSNRRPVQTAWLH